MRTLILSLAFGVASAHAAVVCTYEDPSSVSKVRDTGAAAFLDKVEPEGLTCGGPDMCSADIVCVDGNKSVKMKAFCASVDGGMCPADATRCAEGNYLGTQWKENMVAAGSAVTPTSPPADAGGAGLR